MSVLDDIDFQVELMRNDLINVKYIMDLIGQINLSDVKARDEKRHQIHKLLDKADDQQLRLKADLIRSFLDKVVPSLKEDSDINEAYYEFEDKEKTKEIDIFAEQKDFSAILLNEAVNEYEYSGNIDRKSIGQNISEPFMKRKRKPTKLYSLLKILLKNMVWLNNFIKSLYFSLLQGFLLYTQFVVIKNTNKKVSQISQLFTFHNGSLINRLEVVETSQG